MPGIKVNQYVAAPPDVVFKYSTSIESWPDFIGGIDRVELLTDGPVGVGTRFRETRTMYGKESSEEMEITEFNPPSSYIVEAKSHGAHYVSRFDFEENDAGTLVTMFFDARPMNFLAKIVGLLMMPMMKKAVAKCVQEDLMDLKKYVEAGQ